MCEQVAGVWDSFRMLVIGGPGLIVLIIWLVKLERLFRQDDERSDSGAASSAKIGMTGRDSGGYSSW